MNKLTTRHFLISFAIAGFLAMAGSLHLSISPVHAQSDGTNQSTTTEPTCPKCNGAMEAGIIRDYFASNGFDTSVWCSSRKKAHFFSKNKTIKITVFRCTKCGYLESYAKEN